jgi:hypothetical protein
VRIGSLVSSKEPGSPGPKTEESEMATVLTTVVPMFVAMSAIAVPMVGVRVLERKAR